MATACYYVPGWSVLRVAGPDAASFLHNLCTNEVLKMPAGQACEALFTNVKGKVLAHAILCRQEEVIDVVVTSPRATELAEHLDRYHIREDLTLEAQPELKPTLLWNADQDNNDGYFALAALDATLWLPLGESELPGEAMDEAEFTCKRIERRFPLDYIDVDERNLPQELNRDAQLISFTKGCYLGQETVARIDALGQVNRTLVNLRWREEATNIPAPGAECLIGDKAVGWVTSIGLPNASNAPLILAYVRREHAKQGSRLNVAQGEAEVC